STRLSHAPTEARTCMLPRIPRAVLPDLVAQERMHRGDSFGTGGNHFDAPAAWPIRVSITNRRLEALHVGGAVGHLCVRRDRLRKHPVGELARDRFEVRADRIASRSVRPILRDDFDRASLLRDEEM